MCFRRSYRFSFAWYSRNTVAIFVDNTDIAGIEVVIFLFVGLEVS